MTSFNHYALGAVAEWLHERVGGLAPGAPGYRRIRIAPRPRGPIRSAGATHVTPFGVASVDWEMESDVLTLEAVVPPGTTAVFDIEGCPDFERGPGHHVLRFDADPSKRASPAAFTGAR